MGANFLIQQQYCKNLKQQHVVMSCNLLMENLKDSSVHAQQTILIQRYNKMVCSK